MEVYLHSFLASSLDGRNWSGSRSSRLAPVMPITYDAGWVLQQSGFFGEKKRLFAALETELGTSIVVTVWAALAQLQYVVKAQGMTSQYAVYSSLLLLPGRTYSPQHFVPTRIEYEACYEMSHRT